MSNITITFTVAPKKKSWDKTDCEVTVGYVILIRMGQKTTFFFISKKGGS